MPSSSAFALCFVVPASSKSLATPFRIEGITVSVADSTAPPPTFTIALQKTAKAAVAILLHPLKAKMFGMAVPTAW
jgi:hypothetical protein